MADQQAAPAVPFTIGSRVSSRSSFSIPAVPLGTSIAIPPNTPVQLPAVGYVKNYRIELTAVITGGGAATLQPDAPWNIIDHISLKNSGGETIIAPVTGYELYIINKYAGVGQGLVSPTVIQNDPKVSKQYVGSNTSIHFFLDIPVEFDASAALGVLPATASNRSYNLEIALAPIATVFGGTIPTAVNVTIDATVNYWDLPSDTSSQPYGLGTLSLWQKEIPQVTSGEQLTKTNNTGNIIREHIFVLRNVAGARIDADWTSIFELVFDNTPMLRLKKSEWQDAMCNAFGYPGATFDAPGALDTGVYVLPYQLFAGGEFGSTDSSRAQFLTTLDATQLQFHGLAWGANANTLTVLTNSISTDNAGFVYSK